jgi:hypothetical protein
MTRTRLKQPERFSDPSRISLERYAALQAAEGTHFESRLAGAIERSRQQLATEFGEPQAIALVGSYMSEHAATKYVAHAIANAELEPFQRSCICQLMDEQRHADMDRLLLELVGVPEAHWDGMYQHPTTHHLAFEHLLGLDDPFEIIFKANFVLESGAAAAAFPRRLKRYQAEGFELGALIDQRRIKDEARHVALGTAVARALLEDDGDNLDRLQRWQDEILVLFAMSAQHRSREYWESYVAPYYRKAIPMGLKVSAVAL